jgi:hypothetical protein
MLESIFRVDFDQFLYPFLGLIIKMPQAFVSPFQFTMNLGVVVSQLAFKQVLKTCRFS